MAMADVTVREKTGRLREVGVRPGQVEGLCVGIDQTVAYSIVGEEPDCHAGMNGIGIKEPPREMVGQRHGAHNRLRHETNVESVSDVPTASRAA